MSVDPQTGAADRVLALRRGERDRLRDLRAERLARLRAVVDPAGEVPPAAAAEAADAPEAEAAMQEFLRALLGDEAVAPVARDGAREPVPVALVPAPCDLARLPGAGPGLVRALQRAGVRGLSEVAQLTPADLAARLGPIGRLVPAQSWVAAALREGGTQPGA